MKKIPDALEKTRNPYEVQRMTGCKLSDIRATMMERGDHLPGWGRPSLQRHIISRRRATAPHWPVEDAQTLIDAKRDHDRGRVTMCQGRDGEWIIQYAVPSTRQPIRRTPWFY